MEVKSTIENVDDVTRRVKVTIPAETVTRELDAAVKQIAKTTKVKGFRPGKAPRDIVEKLHGERARWEVINRLISSTLGEIIQKNELDMIGRPEIDVASFEPGKDIEYTADISLYPKPEIKHYERFKVSLTKREVTDKEVDDVVSRMRDARATIKKLEDRETAQLGDVIDAQVTVAVGSEQPSPPEPLVVALGEGKIPAELDSGIVGMTIGEIKSVVVTSPAEGEQPAKTTTYQVTLNGISEKILPDLNDEFAASLGMPDAKTVGELRDAVQKQLDAEQKKLGKSDLQTAVLEQLVEKNDFPVPQVLIDEEIRNLLVRSGLVDSSKQKDLQNISVEKFRDGLGVTAIKRVKTAVIVDRIAQAESIKPEEQDLEQVLGEMSAESGVTPEELKKYLVREKLIGNLMLEVTRNKVLDLLTKRAEVDFAKSA